MGRIVAPGTVFRQKAVMQGQGAGRAMSTQFGLGEAAQALQLAEAIGGSKAVGALFQGLLSAGVKVSDLFAQAPSQGPVGQRPQFGATLQIPRLAAEVPDETVFVPTTAIPPTPQEQALERLHALQAQGRATLARDPRFVPAPEQKMSPEFPGPLPLPPLGVAPNQAFVAPLPGAPGDVAPPGIEPIFARPAEVDAQRQAIIQAVQGQVEQFLVDGGSGADAMKALIDRGSPRDEAERIVRAALSKVARTAAPERDPDQDDIATALRRGSDPAEIARALAQRRLAAQATAEAPARSLDDLDVLEQAGLLDAAERKVRKVRKVSQLLSPPPPKIPPTREEALTLASTVRTPKDRARAVDAIMRSAKPRTFLDLVTGDHLQAALAEAVKLMPDEDDASLVESRLALAEKRRRETEEAQATFENRKAKLAEETKLLKERAERLDLLTPLEKDKLNLELDKLRKQAKGEITDPRDFRLAKTQAARFVASRLQETDRQITSLDRELREAEVAAALPPKTRGVIEGTAGTGATKAIARREEQLAKAAQLPGLRTQMQGLITLRTALFAAGSAIAQAATPEQLDAALGKAGKATTPAVRTGAITPVDVEFKRERAPGAMAPPPPKDTGETPDQRKRRLIDNAKRKAGGH